MGQYPSGVIDWSKGDWQIGTPFGKFATFTLALVDPKAQHAEIHFSTPHIFAGVDVYNDGDADATVNIRPPEIRDVSFTIKPKELRRLRTGWRDPSSSISFDFVNGQSLRFNNLAYRRAQSSSDSSSTYGSIAETLGDYGIENAIEQSW